MDTSTLVIFLDPEIADIFNTWLNLHQVLVLWKQINHGGKGQVEAPKTIPHPSKIEM